MLFEDCLLWPDDRILSELVRLPKPEGGHRLIVLSSTVIRVWAKARQPLSAEWQARHPCEEMWGTRGGQTSSDSAFSHSLEQE
eukprot:2377404-Pyramimonas_sp.AAC.1